MASQTPTTTTRTRFSIPNSIPLLQLQGVIWALQNLVATGDDTPVPQAILNFLSRLSEDALRLVLERVFFAEEDEEGEEDEEWEEEEGDDDGTVTLTPVESEDESEAEAQGEGEGEAEEDENDVEQ